MQKLQTTVVRPGDSTLLITVMTVYAMEMWLLSLLLVLVLTVQLAVDISCCTNAQKVQYAVLISLLLLARSLTPCQAAKRTLWACWTLRAAAATAETVAVAALLAAAVTPAAVLAVRLLLL
jgi:hypothetical protein